MKGLKKIPLKIPELRITVWVSEDARVGDVRERYLARSRKLKKVLVNRRKDHNYF